MVGAWRLLVVIMLVACRPPIPELPGKGGPDWVELKSAHFTMWTDASAESGRELLRKLEHHRQVVMRAMNNAPSKARSFVIALRDAREASAFLPDGKAAVAWPPTAPNRQPGILLAVDTEERDHAVSHELTHVICFGIFKSLPAWLDEGLATFFGMVDFKSDAAEVKLGLPREDFAAFLVTSRPVPSAKLFVCRDNACEDNAFYATSWALFSFLINTHTNETIQYLRHLQQVPEARQASLWNDDFPDLPPDEIDAPLEQWLQSGHFATPIIKVSVLEPLITEHPLGAGDALAARSLLHLVVVNDRPAALEEVTAALALDHTNVLARLVDATLLGSIDRETARATAAAHPDDWRAWWLLGTAVQQGPEATEALAKLCGLAESEVPACAQLRP